MAEDRARQTAAKLHTAGPNIPDRDIRLDLLCPAAFGSGPAGARRVTRTYPEGSGLKVAGINQDVPLWGMASFIAMSHVTVRGDRTASRRPFIRGPLRVCESPL